jgi:hypothetical protein
MHPTKRFRELIFFEEKHLMMPFHAPIKQYKIIWIILFNHTYHQPLIVHGEIYSQCWENTNRQRSLTNYQKREILTLSDAKTN